MKVNFLGSFVKRSQCPKPEKPEYVFAGRSNVGKSSLINYLLDQKNIARVSSTPGKTQHFNYFLIEDKWCMVDIPGYGFARRPTKQRDTWEIEMYDFLQHRESLQCVFMLVDISVEPKKNDLAFADWLGEHGVPFVIIFTKTDRQSALANENSFKAFEAAMLETWEAMPQYFFTSAEKKTGREELLNFIVETNKNWKS